MTRPLCVLVLVACSDEERLASGESGGSTQGTDSTPSVVWSTGATPSPEMVTACRGLYDAFESWWEGCGQIALARVTLDGMAARCAAETTLPGLTVSRAAIDDCAERIAASPCAQAPVDCFSGRERRSWAEVPRITYSSLAQDVAFRPETFGYEELFPRVTGSLGLGQPCDDSRQCASRLCGTTTSSDYALPSGPSDCGVCVVERQTGEACGGAEICQPGATCVAGRCQEVGLAVGQPCQSIKGDSDCQRSAYCDTVGEGRCVPKPGPGEACGGLLHVCREGLWCVDGRCETMRTAHGDEACGGATFCPDGLTCDGGVCRLPRGDIEVGELCGYDRCGPGLLCVSSTSQCTTPATKAEVCAFSCGVESRCSAEGDCVPRPVDGEPCSNERECAPGLYCAGGLPYGDGRTVCRPLPVEGQFCDPWAPCAPSLRCIDGQCRPLDACTRRR